VLHEPVNYKTEYKRESTSHGTRIIQTLILLQPQITSSEASRAIHKHGASLRPADRLWATDTESRN